MGIFHLYLYLGCFFKIVFVKNSKFSKKFEVGFSNRAERRRREASCQKCLGPESAGARRFPNRAERRRREASRHKCPRPDDPPRPARA